MTNNLEELFENNWDEIKGNIKTQWGKLTNQDVKQIEGSYDILVAKLKKTYGYTRDEIHDDLEAFLDSEGIQEIKNKIKDVRDDAEEKAFSIKNIMCDYVQSYFNSLKEKSITLEESIISYAKENPMKVLGTAAVVSYALTKVLSPKE